MSDHDFTQSFTVDQDQVVVFDAVNNVRGWWSGSIEGDTDRLGAVFTYRMKDIHRATMTITEFVPGQRVVWHVTDSYISFVNDTDEWDGTDVVFDIASKGSQTELRFTHVGLRPDMECYDACFEGWSMYLDSLQKLIVTGEGAPNTGEARTESEKEFLQEE